MPSARALMRMLMSLDTRMTLRFGCACDRCMTTAMIWLSALPPASDGGSAVVIASVCRNRRPVAAPPLAGFRGIPVEIARGLPGVASNFGNAFLVVVELLEREDREVQIVFFETEDAGGIVHQHVGVEHEKLGRRSLGGLADVGGETKIALDHGPPRAGGRRLTPC